MCDWKNKECLIYGGSLRYKIFLATQKGHWS